MVVFKIPIYSQMYKYKITIFPYFVETNLYLCNSLQNGQTKEIPKGKKNKYQVLSSDNYKSEF